MTSRTARARAFWDRVADRYAARPIKDVPAYEAMLADAARYLGPEDRVLELGCGTGTMAVRLAKGVQHYRATDFSARMIAIARAKPAPESLEFQVSSAETAFAGGPFDAICAFNLLHLVDDMHALLAQVHDTLPPGGVLISRTWCFAELPLPFRGLFAMLRLVGLFPPVTWLRGADLRRAITASGLVIEVDKTFGTRPQNPFIVARKPIWRRACSSGSVA
jgi:SAM-dependent methyltransferase